MTHTYEISLRWSGSGVQSTKSYKSYTRDHVITGSEKPPIAGSSDPSFRGDPSRYNPEELFLSSISSCHMLWYLHLCSDAGVEVISYEDHPVGHMVTGSDGSGSFTEVTLRPTVKYAEDTDIAKAAGLHDEAHAYCFIANSVNFPIRIQPQ